MVRLNSPGALSMRPELATSGSVVLVIAVALVLSGCGGSNKVASSPTQTTAPINEKLAKSVPARFKVQPLIVASDATLAPMEFVQGKKKYIVGADIDIATALAQTLGLRLVVQNVSFADIIPGVRSGAYDLGVSSATVTKARETKVDFVSYFQAGSSYYVRKGSRQVSKPGDLCGQTIAVQRGTVAEALAVKQKPKCAKARPLKIERFSGQTAATQAVSKGAADVTITDTPIATWAVRNSKGKLTLSGKPFGVAPYGIAIAKGSGLTGPLNKAMNELIANGVYDNILLKWGLNAGAIEKSVINSAKK